MLSRSAIKAGGLINRQLFSSCRPHTVCVSSTQRGHHLVRYQNTASNSSDDTHHDRPSRHRESDRKRSRRKLGNKSRRVELEYSSLGKPGEVLVVREKPSRQRPLRASSEEEAGELPIMLSELQPDTSYSDSAVIAERIESFLAPHRPREQLAPPDWEDLRSRLRPSFTAPQLSKYISTTLKARHDSTEGIPAHLEHWNAEWKPGTSHYLETGPASQETIADRIAASQDLKGKDLLIERVLRDCWQLGQAGEIGQLDIRLPRYSLTLLTGSNYFSFEELANLHETAIDVTHSLGLVRVTGKQRPCESIREIINDYTKRIQSVELGLPSRDNENTKKFAEALSPGFISWVETTYKVSFELDSLQFPNRMHVLPENERNVEDARRTLHLAFNKAASPSTPFSTYFPASKLSKMYDVDLGEAAPWQVREKPWFRWQTPESERLPILPGYLLHEGQSDLCKELLTSLRRQPSWSAKFGSAIEVRESITATLGQCLFLRKPTIEKGQASASQLGQMSLLRTFVSDVPRVSRLLGKLSPKRVESTSYRIRLVPSALHANIFPSLELELTHPPKNIRKHQNELVISGAQVNLMENSVDHLLPESIADIRFTRKLTHDLLTGPHGVSFLDSVLEDVQLELKKSRTSNKDIPLPAFTTLNLPSYLLQQDNEKVDMTACTKAEYVYQPVNDVQGTLVNQYDVRDWRLFHASYDGGPYGAHSTTDLYLQATSEPRYIDEIHPGKSVSSRRQIGKDFVLFYNVACDMVSGLELDAEERAVAGMRV